MHDVYKGQMRAKKYKKRDETKNLPAHNNLHVVK